MSAGYEVRGRTAVITLERPPTNALGRGMRRSLVDALLRAEDDAGVTAVVLIGAGRGFSGGADLREFDAPQGEQPPRLPDVIAAIEASRKPVVAALHGVCAGGGLELALGCHYRVAAPGATLALPELRLGLVPGAGGTQRLPRAIGVEAALDMVLRGEPLRGEALAAMSGQRLIDRLIEGGLLEGALAFAAEVAAQRPLPHLRDLEAAHPQAEAFFQFARHALRAREARPAAALRALDCVAAALTMDFEAGLAHERDSFRQLLRTPESRALRHAVFAERAAGRIPEVPEHTPVRALYKTAIVGAGATGGGIALALLNAGLPVVLQDPRPEALERCLGAIGAHGEAQVRRGRLRPAEAEQRMSLLRGTLSDADIRDADLVIEATAEDPALKRQVFARLDEVMKPGAILASASAEPLLDEIAAATRRPQDVVGLHFFGASPAARLLEVVRGAATAPDVLATVMRLAQRMRRTAVVCGLGPGFIARRLAAAAQRQAGVLIDVGCAPAQLDRAMADFGFSAGPCRGAELTGAAAPDAGMAAPGPFDAAEIAERLVCAMVDEAARLLDEGVALRAADVDLVALAGLGFPLWRGGPLWHADALGLSELVQRMRRLDRRLPAGAPRAEPAPLLARLAREGGSFH